ncbi:MAG: hypothetical protein AB1585_02165 [Thermodesulfobacteriota bacterium]
MGQSLSPVAFLHQHLRESFQIKTDDIPRLLEDIFGFFSSTLEDFVQSRHLDLKATGIKNEEIYRTLQKEIEERRFKAPSLSIRQIRRMIYG